MTTLFITNSGVKTINSNALKCLPFLESVDLSSNKLETLQSKVFLPVLNLKFLNLANNALTKLQPKFWGISNSLEELDLSRNGFPYPSRLHEYTNLKSLKMYRNPMRDSRDGFHMKSVVYLDMGSNLFTKFQDSHFQEMLLLKVVRLENSTKLILFDKYDSANPFNNPSIQTLKISGIDFRLNSNGHVPIFTNMTNLTELGISQSSMFSDSILPSDLFHGATQLSILNLGRNQIVSWKLDAFKSLSKLQFLYLAHNKITHTNRTMFQDLISLLQVNLSHNSLVCSCDLFWFRLWIIPSPINVKYIGDGKKYSCAAPAGMTSHSLLDFPMSEDKCVDKTVFIVSTTVSLVVFTLIIIATVVHRYRYYLKLFIFYAKSRLQRRHGSSLYQFDAFVAYAVDDLPWVINDLLPELEYERGYHLCLHHRNWIPGIEVIANITTSLEKSRKVILVLSDKFATSGWCQVETSMAHLHMIEGGRNPIVMVKLGDIETGHMTVTLRHLMTTQTYLPWSEDAREQKAFWRKLGAALKPPRGRRTRREEDNSEGEGREGGEGGEGERLVVEMSDIPRDRGHTVTDDEESL